MNIFFFIHIFDFWFKLITNKGVRRFIIGSNCKLLFGWHNYIFWLCFIYISSFSRVTQLLERISEVVEQNRLFTSDRPGLGQDLETLQQHLESLSAAAFPPEYNFNGSQG